MKRAIATGILTLALVGGVGCGGYADERPPVDQLDSRDEGLQSKEIVNATDAMAQSLKRDDDLARRTEKLIIVVDKMDDDTTTEFPKDLFLRRLKTSIGREFKGQVQLVENRDRLKGMQSRELEGEVGAAPGQPGPIGLQPDYALNGRITELRKQGTSYYYLEFNLTGLKGADARLIVWTDAFEVKVAR